MRVTLRFEKSLVIILACGLFKIQNIATVQPLKTGELRIPEPLCRAQIRTVASTSSRSIGRWPLLASEQSRPSLARLVLPDCALNRANDPNEWIPGFVPAAGFVS